MSERAGAAREVHFLRRVFDQISDCLVAIDVDGRIVLINQAYCELLRGRETDFLGRHITTVVGPATRLHLVAKGGPVELGYPLDIRGKRLISKQVPVMSKGKIVGAVGMAMASDLRSPSKPRGNSGRTREDNWQIRFTLNDIFGQGKEIATFKSALERAASHDFPVLITGETGTGKELGAQSIHHLSARSRGPFVWVNCASIPPDLIEAELFGYEGGAFTGAKTKGKEGKFELAAGGTIFLDEIGDMPAHLQSSLLRILQTNQFVRVGGTSPIDLDARLICATHRSLEQLVEEKLFRSDLLYRLDVVTIRAPSLRERDDKDQLIGYLVKKVADKTGREFHLTARQRELLLQHDWPGNVRELENTLVRLVLSGELLIRTKAAARRGHGPSGSGGDLKAQIETAKQQAIRSAMDAANGDKERAANALKISRAQLYRELQKIGGKL